MRRAISYRVTTEPTAEPITLAELKLQCRIDYNDDDILLTNCIPAARQYCEDFTNRAFIDQTITALFTSFNEDENRLIELPKPYLINVTSVKYYDENGTLQTIANTDYTVDTTRLPGAIKFKDTFSIPTLSTNYEAPIQVIYKAGYANASSVPQKYKQAILLLAACYYENRSDITNFQTFKLPNGINAILKPLRYQNAW